MTRQQEQIVIGCILGDAYLQKTGKRNARLRLEHSVKQKEYIFWKQNELKNFMQDRPKLIKRYNPVFRKHYRYYRCQSHSTPIFGKLQRLFYLDNKKQIPPNISSLFSKLALAVWFMDDGYYYQKDKIAYIYLSQFPVNQIKCLAQALKSTYGLNLKIEIKKKGNYNFRFSVVETAKLLEIIKPYVIKSMSYKVNT